jgi:hypothetical protein
MNDIGAQQGVAMGNARNQAVRDLNERIRQHNTDVANQISGLKDQEKTTKTILGAKDAAQALWTGKGMPDKIKAYNDWRAKKATGQGKSNPKSEEETTQTENAGQNEPISNDATSESQQAAQTEAPAEPVAEGAPTSETGAVQSTSEAAEGAEGALKEGLESAGKSVLKTEGKTLLGRAGEGVGVLGSAALGGIDLYEDIKDGKIEGNNAWEKASNILQIGGSLADIAGVAFPPAKLLGGVLDLASAATEQVGEATDSTTTDELNKEQAQETEQQVGVEQQTQEAGIGVQ